MIYCVLPMGVRKKTRIKVVLGIVLLFYLGTFELFGCIYNVRDVGFVDLMPIPYRLYCFIQDDTPAEFTSDFKQIAYATFMDCNVKVEIINTDRNTNHPAMEYFHLWEIESCPATVLISPNGRSMVLPISVPGKISKESIRSTLESMVTSPKRTEILEHIIKSYCVLLLIEGRDETENNKAYAVAQSAIKKIAGIMPQLPKRIEEPPFLISVKKELVLDESILLWSLGFDVNQVRGPCVAVIYGRGRKIGPLIRGTDLTRSKLFNILSLIGLSCECGLDKRWMMGTMIPLSWGEKIQSDVVRSLGFDAENPMVKTEISSIMSFDFSLGKEAGWISEDTLDNYSEEVLKFGIGVAVARVSPARFQEFISPVSSNSKSGLNLKTLLSVIGIVVLLVLAGGGFVLLRARRKRS